MSSAWDKVNLFVFLQLDINQGIATDEYFTRIGAMAKKSASWQKNYSKNCIFCPNFGYIVDQFLDILPTSSKVWTISNLKTWVF